MRLNCTVSTIGVASVELLLSSQPTRNMARKASRAALHRSDLQAAASFLRFQKFKRGQQFGSRRRFLYALARARLKLRTPSTSIEDTAKLKQDQAVCEAPYSNFFSQVENRMHALIPSWCYHQSTKAHVPQSIVYGFKVHKRIPKRR